ncbi:MAG: hypothetical protein GY866_03715 [Proteobacteria bacterium]|nr:hypothetical protein [Pseudomonadota bacterium]
MKTIFLLEITENELVKRHRFQERDAAVFTLLVDLSDTGNEYSIKLTTGDETVASYGLEADDVDLNLNQPALLMKDGSNFVLNLKNPGLHHFHLDMSDESRPMLSILEEDQDADRKGTGLDHFLNSKLPVTFEVGKTEMLIHEVLSLGQGSVIELHRLVGQALDVYVGEELVAKGEVVIMPDHTFGARVVKVLPIAGEMTEAFNPAAGEK